MYDLGMIITDAIVFMLTVVFVYIFNVHVKPYLQDKHLAEVANIVVHTAQSVYGFGHGPEKLAYAIQLMNEKFNIKMDEEKIIAAVEAAWKAMDIEQVKSGDKEREATIEEIA